MHLLGEVAITVDGEPIELGTPKERQLFAVLALHAGALVSRDRVVEALWPDRPPAKPAASLRPYVSHLRDALASAGFERDVLETGTEGYALRVDRSLLDIERFERLVEAAHDDLANAGERASVLDDALVLVRGEPFADMPYAEFAQAEIHRLTELIAGTHELRAELAVEAGDAARWVPRIAGLVERYPNRDRLCGALMRALAETGRRGEALRAFSAHRERLIDEMGLDPGPELRALEIEILSIDDAVDAPAAAPVEPDDPVEVVQRRLATAIVVAEPMTDADRVLVATNGGTPDPDDAQVGWFGLAATREGDADRAVRAALELTRDGSGRVGVVTGWITPDADLEELVDIGSAFTTGGAEGAVVVDETTSRLAGRWIAFESAQSGGFRAVGVGRSDATPPIVGRDEELLLVRRRLARAADGEGQVVVIVGDAGIGKSRLIDALVTDVADMRVVRFGCQPFHGGRAFHAVADAVGRGRTRLLADHPMPSVAAARRLLTNWAADGDDALVSVSDDAEARRQAVRRAVITHVVADESPVVCVVEDVQWADPSTEELVGALSDATLDHPVALVLSARTHSDAAVATAANATTLPLGGMARSDLVAIVNSNASVELPDDLAQSVAERAAGNPLFAEEMARSLDLAALDPSGVPASIHDALLTRLDQYPECRAVADAVAVVGTEVETRVIANVLDRYDTDVEADLRRLCAEGVLVRRGTGDRERFRFRHALVRDAVHAAIPVDRLEALAAFAPRSAE